MRKLLYFLVVCLIAFASYGAAPAVIGTAGGVEGGEDAGPITFVTDNGTNGWITSAPWSVSTTVNVQAGDLIVVHGSVTNGYGIASITDDDAGNTYTVITSLTVGTTDETVGYVTSADSTMSPLTVTVTSNEGGAGGRRVYIQVHVFRPASGESVTYDCRSYDQQTSSEPDPWETDQSTGSTTGTDEACSVAFIDVNTAATLSNPEIPTGTSASSFTYQTLGMNTFYNILTSTVSNIEAEVTASASGTYIGDAVCFKAE